ncbi:hypothetical protein GCK72_022000 [Caenorhabditis remanei]|uniref:Uncharacterized protein n=2 Tax=Caenorhabditis remanei TaxID=31234 RepID=E3MEU7_CAERE|nr:hypothetical protein GCK72_022000 [Caenorhabditis remanei]EFP00687.1 hypothetical protein CRE_21205 [Caenorhabditis remanei]KAF1755431.1 hypothetical protein GCK72_022000 [Caenorhabditis remanei]
MCCIRLFQTPGTILAQLNEYRETLYIIFGITCLVSWLCFNLWALREFFCPTIFSSANSSTSRRHNTPEDRLTRIKMQYISSGRLLTNLTASASATLSHANRRASLPTDFQNLEVFVV